MFGRKFVFMVLAVSLANSSHSQDESENQKPEIILSGPNADITFSDPRVTRLEDLGARYDPIIGVRTNGLEAPKSAAITLLFASSANALIPNLDPRTPQSYEHMTRDIIVSYNESLVYGGQR